MRTAKRRGGRWDSVGVSWFTPKRAGEISIIYSERGVTPVIDMPIYRIRPVSITKAHIAEAVREVCTRTSFRHPTDSRHVASNNGAILNSDGRW